MKTFFTFVAISMLYSAVASAGKYEVQCNFKSPKRNGYKIGRISIDLDLDKKTATTKHLDSEADGALFVCEDSWKVLAATNENGQSQKTLVTQDDVDADSNAYILLSGGNCDDTSYSIQIINGIEGDQTHSVFVVSWNSGEEISSFNANQCSVLKK